MAESGPQAEIWKECYAQCFQDKRHYDLLSWSVGAAMLAFTAFVLGLILDVPAEMTTTRVAYAACVVPLFIVWILIYERNRVWGEICNEVARDIERRFDVDGIQLRYMRAHLTGTVDRSNIDLPAHSQALPKELVPGIARPFRMLAPSMHYALYALAFLVLAVPMILALSPAQAPTPLERAEQPEAKAGQPRG